MNFHAVAEALRQLALAIEADDEPRVPAAVPPPGDLAVGEVAVRFRRSPSTVRSWFERGVFEGAYKLNGRDWRVPLSAVEAFERSQRGERRPGAGADLGAWRRRRLGNVSATPGSGVK